MHEQCRTPECDPQKCLVVPSCWSWDFSKGCCDSVKKKRSEVHVQRIVCQAGSTCTCMYIHIYKNSSRGNATQMSAFAEIALATAPKKHPPTHTQTPPKTRRPGGHEGLFWRPTPTDPTAHCEFQCLGRVSEGLSWGLLFRREGGNGTAHPEGPIRVALWN